MGGLVTSFRRAMGLDEEKTKTASAPPSKSSQEAMDRAIPRRYEPTVKPKRGRFDTALSPAEEAKFQVWKKKHAPKDSGEDYDLRGAFKAGLVPDPKTGHWSDRFKKPNHPTFSNESQYYKEAPEKAGRWTGAKHDKFVPPAVPLSSLGGKR